MRRLLDYTAGNLDNLVVGKTMGMTSLGLYDKAYSTMSRFLTRINSGGPSVMFRIFAMIHEEPERFQRAYSRMIMTATLAAFPFFAIMFVIAPHVMVVLFGRNWAPATAPFQVLCLVGALRVVNTYASSATQAAGRVWAEVWRQVGYVAMIVIGIVILAQWGPIGAASAVLIATAVMTISMHVLVRRVTQLSWRQIITPMLPGMAAAAVAGSATFATQLVIWRVDAALPAWLQLGLDGIVGVLACAAFVLFVPIQAVRSLVADMTSDLAPDFVKRQRFVRAYLQS